MRAFRLPSSVPDFSNFRPPMIAREAGRVEQRVNSSALFIEVEMRDIDEPLCSPPLHRAHSSQHAERRSKRGRPTKGLAARERIARFRIAASTIDAMAAFGLSPIEILEGIERLAAAAHTNDDARFWYELLRVLLDPSYDLDAMLADVGVAWLMRRDPTLPAPPGSSSPMLPSQRRAQHGEEPSSTGERSADEADRQLGGEEALVTARTG